MRRSLLFRIDWALLIPALILVVISLTTLFSLNAALFRTQLLYVVVALGVFVFFSQVNHKILQFYSWPIYIVSCILLLLVLVIGLETRGAVRWIDILGFRFQFSELIKPFYAIILASYLSSRTSSFRTFAITLLLSGPIIFLIFIQPDLGTAMIYFAALVLMLILYGFPFLWFGLGFLMTAASMPIVWQFLHDYQKKRILTFISPSADPLGSSYNAIQAVIAVGSGMMFGKGLSEGTQSGLRFLPERHTDFIFATLSEGLGFVGAVVLIGTFIVLLFRIYTIFIQSEDNFAKIYAAFTFSLILIQAFVNIGMNVGLLPIVGITLPFVSYGGSSLLSNFILLGLLSSISSTARNKNILEIR